MGTTMYTTLIRSMPSFPRRMMRLNTINIEIPSKATCPAVPGISSRALSWTSVARNKEMFSITYELGGGEKHTVQAKDGDNLLDVVINNELDMLDLAFGLTDTSRLGCQVCMSKELDGITVK